MSAIDPKRPFQHRWLDSELERAPKCALALESFAAASANSPVELALASTNSRINGCKVSIEQLISGPYMSLVGAKANMPESAGTTTRKVEAFFVSANV